FASIWAQIAWDRFWGWDPIEVWALITFLFYAVFLHLRLSRGWHGEKSAWLAVIGCTIIMLNIIAVNLVLAGLRSYAYVYNMTSCKRCHVFSYTFFDISFILMIDVKRRLN